MEQHSKFGLLSLLCICVLAAVWTLTIAGEPLASAAIGAPANKQSTLNAEQESKKQQAKSAKQTKLQKSTKEKSTMTMDTFLDRLMIAESGGNDEARNRLSTATGPYQFIQSTFISVMRRHFPKRIERLSNAQILALRTSRPVSRDAARAYTKDNATLLVAAGQKATFPHLRLAFLLGPGGAIRILSAKPETPLPRLLSLAVLRANPWMRRLTAGGLIVRSARDISTDRRSLAGVKPRRDPVTGKLIMSRHARRKPRIRVRCNLGLPSCRRWLSLKRKQLARKRARRVAQSKR